VTRTEGVLQDLDRVLEMTVVVPFPLLSQRSIATGVPDPRESSKSYCNEKFKRVRMSEYGENARANVNLY